MLRDHMEILATATNFPQAWQSLGESWQILYSRLLRTTDDLRDRLQQDRTLHREHVRALRTSRRFFADVGEWEPHAPPDPEARIRWSIDAEQVADCSVVAWERLRHVVLYRRLPYVVRWTSIKRGRAVAEKIAAYRAGGRLDLDDVVRARYCFDSLHDLRLFLEALISEFGDDVARLRNYFLRQQEGPDDAYCALHLVIALPRVSRYAFFEVQLMTAVRDALGLLDHDFVHKACLDYRDASQREWLQGLRLAANVIDADRARFYRLKRI